MNAVKARRIKLSVLGAAAGLLITMWAIDLTASAHEGHRHAPASARKLKNPLNATEENEKAGRALYDRQCASCHGDDGKAKTAVAEAMKVTPADLTGHAMHGITDGEIYWVVTNGIKKSGMPALKTKTKPDERWQLVLYVRQLMREQPQTGSR